MISGKLFVDYRKHLFVFLFLADIFAEIAPRGVESFSPTTTTGLHSNSNSYRTLILRAVGNDDNNESNDERSSLSNYKDSDSASKGIVGSLTGIVNKVSATRERNKSPSDVISSSLTSAPATPEELLDRIRKDYEERNYLWTGDLDLDCFCQECTFTDPTISFTGIDKFKENTQNLVPIVEAFAEDYRSELLSISLGTADKMPANSPNDSANADGFYVETRWNMVGSLTASPWFFWKPKIDVIGRTKFWYRREEAREGEESGYRVYFYDESWEIAAWKALLQIITPAGTFPSSSAT